MTKKIIIHILFTPIFLLFISLFIFVHIKASDVRSYVSKENINNIEEKNSYKEKLNLDLLYVFEEKTFNEIINKNSLFITNNNYIIVNDEISEENLEIINSAKKYYILGEINTEKFALDNLNNVFTNGYEKEINIKNDLIIVNEESLIDVLNAIQISNIEERTFLFIKDNNLTYKDELFIKTYGIDKNILFIEGELNIPLELKYNILQLANSAKYEIDTFSISKQIQNVNLNDYQYKINNYNIMRNINIFNDALKFKNIFEKNNKQNETKIYNMNKLLNYENNVEEYMFTQDNSYKFINHIKTKNNIALTVTTNQEVNYDYKFIKEKEYEPCLKLTYADPVSLHKYIPVNKKMFIPSKNVTNEIMYEVMEGSYGTEEDEMKINLEKEGYNYEEIKKEIDKILEIRRKSIKTAEIIKSNKKHQLTDLQKSFLKELYKMKNWTYSQERRWDEGYADCSSIIIRALFNTNMITDFSNMTTRTIHNDPRFYEISLDEIQLGDILWYPGHVEVYIGGDNTFGAFRPSKPAGYATGVYRFTKAYRINTN